MHLVVQCLFAPEEFIIGEYVDLPPDLDWDGILGLAWESMASAGEPFYRGPRLSHLQCQPLPV